jgi:hypothetical protein
MNAIRDYLGEYPARPGTLIRSCRHPTVGIEARHIGRQ